MDRIPRRPNIATALMNPGSTMLRCGIGVRDERPLRAANVALHLSCQISQPWAEALFQPPPFPLPLDLTSYRQSHAEGLR